MCHCVHCSRTVELEEFFIIIFLWSIYRAVSKSVGRLAPVVQTSDSAVHRINHYPVDSVIGFHNTYPLDSDLSGGQRYPTFEQPGPGVELNSQEFLLVRFSFCFQWKQPRGHVHAVKVSFHQKSRQSSDSDLFFQVDNTFSCVILYPQKHTVCINLHARVRLLTPYQFINIKTVLFYYQHPLPQTAATFLPFFRQAKASVSHTWHFWISMPASHLSLLT